MKKKQTINHHITPSDMTKYIKEELSPEMLRNVELHLIKCPLCSDALDGYLENQKVPSDFNLENTQTPPSSYPTINPSNKIRKLINISVAAAILLALPIALYQYWNHTANERTFSEYFNTPQNSAFLQESKRSSTTNDNNSRLYQNEIVIKAMTAYHDSSTPLPQKIALLREAIKTGENTTTLNYHLGVSLLQDNQNQEALAVLAPITTQGENISYDAQWFSALAYLRLGDKDNAKKYMQQVANNPQASYQKDAIDFLEKR